MMEATDRLINIIEDRRSLDDALHIIMEAAETKVLRPVANIPSFTDERTERSVIITLELVTGKKY